MKTALYTYSTPNIGDDFQSYVMAQVLGPPEIWINRDRAAAYQGEACRLIANAFMTQESFPIAPQIQPKFVAIHLGGMEKPIDPKKLQYFEENAAQEGPIGCRDWDTFRYLDRLQVPCYFAGCPSVLCEPMPGVETEEFILFIDVNPQMFGHLQGQDAVLWHTQRVVDHRSSARQELCRARHELFSAARLIVTSKIHVALPCLGIGKPVIFVRQQIFLPGRLGALPEGFTTYAAGTDELWKMHLDPNLHQFDAAPYREHVRSHLSRSLSGELTAGKSTKEG